MKNLTFSTMLALLILTDVARADSWDTWTPRSPLPTGNTLHSIVYGNGQFVAVGGAGAIVTSADGANWVLRQSGTRNDLSSIAYGNGLFVAVGGGYNTTSNESTIVTSTDGVNWVQRQSGAILLAVAYGNSQFVAVGSGGIILTSSDGSNWVLHQSGGMQNDLLGITYGNGQFVAVGGYFYFPQASTIITSDDGVNWAQRQSGITNAFAAVTYGNGQFVAVGPALNYGHGGDIVSSSDGIKWTVPQPFGADVLHGIAYGNGRFVAVGIDSIATSTNAVDWVQLPSRYDIYGPFYELYGAAYGNGQFVAVGDFGTILTSADGVNWVQRQPKESTYLSDITYGNGQFVAVGRRYNQATSEYEGISEISADGQDWIQSKLGSATPPFSPYYSIRVAYGNGQFVASGYWSNASSGLEGHILTSTNGVNWIPHQTGTTNQLEGIVYGNGRFVALVAGGAVITSDDGTDWVQRPLGAEIALYSITFGNGQFVAYGSYRDGLVNLTSTDGVNWVPGQSPDGFNFHSVAYGNNQFVTVYTSSLFNCSTIRNSTDGLNWFGNQGCLGGGLGLVTIAYGNGHFVVIGNGSDRYLGEWRVHGPTTILTSTDGEIWVQHQSATPNGSSAITYGNGRFVAVGSGILQSGSIINLAISPKAGAGLLTLSLEGPTGLAYTIQSSTDLRSWQNLTNITTSQSSTVIFDPLPAATEQVFYRAYSQEQRP